MSLIKKETIDNLKTSIAAFSEKVKVLFNTEVQLAEAKLKDGTVITYEGELGEGTALLIVTAEGNMPAPDGIHEVVNDTGEVALMVTTEGGKVIKIDQPQAATSEDDKFTELNNKIASLETVINELKGGATKYETQLGEAKKVIEESSGLFTKVIELVEEIAQEPQEQSKNKVHNAFTEMDAKKKERLEEISKLLNKKPQIQN